MRRYLPLGALLVLLLILAVGWFAVVSPQRHDASNVGAQITTAQEQLANLQQQTAAGEATKRNVGKARRDLRRLRWALPDSYAEPALINTLQRQALRNDVDFEGLTFTSAAGSQTTAPTTSTAATTAGQSTTAGVAALAFSLQLAGKYFDLARFIADLQNMSGASSSRIWVAGRLIAFTGVTMTSSRTAAGTVTATVTGNAYLLPVAARPAGATAGGR